MPQAVEVRLAAPVALDGAAVVLASGSYAAKGSRIASLEVQAADEQGAYRRVWYGESLEGQALIAARWPALLSTALRFVVHDQVFATGEPAPAK